MSVSVKRRDSRNRILRNGESQRPDGRYVYVYVDGNGKQRFIYSWKLEETDRLPQGKRKCEALRTKVKKLKRDLDDGITPDGGKMTVLELVRKYTGQKRGVRLATKTNYNYVIGILEGDLFGARRIDRVKLSDAKGWFVKLQDSGKSYSTICIIRSVIKPAFQMAVDDDLLRKNPFEFSTATIIENDSVRRKSITEEQENAFLEFVKGDGSYHKHYDAIYILFNTGLRISELAGLTVSDIDFRNNKIRVDHQLLKRKEGDHIKVMIEKPKTNSGVRYIPMTREVAECFKRVIEKRNGLQNEPVVDGMKGFLFLSRNGVPLDAARWERYFQNICGKYNRTHDELMPKVTPHVCRHTFCSKMARSGMNPKTLQYIMGHANISITMNTYTHLKYEDAEKEMMRVCNGRFY